jgi:hypothetical protein
MTTKAQTFKEPWLAKVEEAVGTAVSIAWEGCHKIYIMSDEAADEDMIDIGYDTIKVDDKSKALAQLFEWWEDSCSLRFINRIETTGGKTGNEQFFSVIPQFDYDEEKGERTWVLTSCLL